MSLQSCHSLHGRWSRGMSCQRAHVQRGRAWTYMPRSPLSLHHCRVGSLSTSQLDASMSRSRIGLQCKQCLQQLRVVSRIAFRLRCRRSLCSRMPILPSSITFKCLSLSRVMVRLAACHSTPKFLDRLAIQPRWNEQGKLSFHVPRLCGADGFPAHQALIHRG